VLLLDLQMPGASAIETVTFVHDHCPQTRVIILTAYDDEVYVRRMFAEGIAGYMLKDDVTDGIVTAIRSVMQGGTWLSRRILDILATQQLHEIAADGDHQTVSMSSQHHALTRQQRKVLRLVGEGMTNDEIASHLSRSSGTIKKHLAVIYKRLHVHDRDTAVHLARHQGCLVD